MDLFQEFFDGYKGTVLSWEDGGGEEYLQQQGFDLKSFDPETEAQMLLDCMKFWREHRQDVMVDEDPDTAGLAGEDFWLGRQGQSTGFQDSEVWSEDARDRLHQAAGEFGVLNAYVEDGLVRLVS